MGITLNGVDCIISVTAPTTQVTNHELIVAIRDWEAMLCNHTFPHVIDTSGKDDAGGGSFTGLVIKLSVLWQIQFWAGVGLGIIKDGTLSGGVGGQPIKPTGAADTVIVNNLVGGVIISTGSGLSTDEHNQLMGLDTEYQKKIINNKKELKKNGSVWELVIYDDNGTTELLNKEMKDSNGDNISDLAAGVLAAEMANTI